MTTVPVCNFVDTLSQSPLLEAAQREELPHLGQRYPDVREFARELLRRDWLTPFQINQLLLGKVHELVLGNYILLERLGEGGMGQVFKARHRTLGRLVAVKVLRANLLGNQTAVRRFMREMETAARLDHVHIVRALDADQVDGTYFIAMELIDGQDLSRLVKQNGPLKIARACDYIRQAALGLQHAHEQGFVHRDVKPSNLLVTAPPEKSEQPATPLGRWGTVKILDLGLARIVEGDDGPAVTQLTQMGVVMGTPDFIAPEQARNSSKIDIRADIYSLGCTFYFLLTGQVPFPKGTLTEKLLQHQLDEPAAVEEVRRTQQLAAGQDPREVKYLSPKVSDLVRKMMAKRPEARFQTPAEVAEALTDLLTTGAAGNNSRGSERLPVVVPLPAGKGQTQPPSGKLRPQPPSSRKLLTVGPISGKHPKLADPPKEGSAEKPVIPPDVPSLAATVVLPSAADATGLAAPAGQRNDAPLPSGSAGKRRSRSRHLLFSLMTAVAGTVGLMALAGLSADSEEPPIQPTLDQVDPLEGAWSSLQARANDPKYPVFDLRRELVAFRAQHPAAEQARKAGDLLLRLKSPLDLLEAGWIPFAERFDWQPQQLVAVLGHRPDPTFVNPALSVAVSPDARQVAGCFNAGQVMLWDATKLHQKIKPTLLGGPFLRATRLVFSPDGQQLAGGTSDGKLLLWDMKTLTFRRVELGWFGEKGRKFVSALAWSPDSKALVAGCTDGSWHLCQPDTLDVKHIEDRSPNRMMLALAFSPEGNLLACQRSDSPWTLHSWPDLKRPIQQPASHPLRGSSTLAFSLDGQLLAVAGGSDGSIQIYRRSAQHFAEEKPLVGGHKERVLHVAFSADGKRLASVCAEHRLIIWDLTTRTVLPLWRYRRSDLPAGEGQLRWQVNSLTWASDGRHLLTANANGTIYVFRLPEASATPVALDGRNGKTG